MKNPRVISAGSALGAVCGLVCCLHGNVYSQDCASALSDDEIVGGIACPDGPSATVVANEPAEPSAVPAAPGVDSAGAAPDKPYNEDLTASLRAVPAAASGAVFTVTWIGPDNHGDYIAIASPDDPGTGQLNYAYTEGGSPLELSAPDLPGSYELRYMQHQPRTVLAREPITVLPVTATLASASDVRSGSTFEVRWTGPDNRGDYIAIAAPDEPAHSQRTYAYTNNGSPLQLTAPDQPGNYELRYLQHQSRNILARQPIEVSE